ncbi:MAG: hypothetical protein JST54_03135 [Deltaproteobacteria bacterium]|nr:hypothetical protein [Deltaproteobacteria bacterium]
MRTLVYGLIAFGAAALGASLVAGSASRLLLEIFGGASLFLGVALFGAERALKQALARTGVRTQHVNALRGALQHGTDRARAALQALREAGLQGVAVVLAVAETGGSFNQRAEVDLELEIRVAGREPYRVKQRHLVPTPRLEKLRVGEALQVTVDPAIAERLLIDWS